MLRRSSMLLALAACAGRPAPAKPAPPTVSWLCRPGLVGNACTSADLTATDLRADGTRAALPHAPDPQPAADCFYVYPTVDLELVPGNHENLDDRRHVAEITLAQVGRFSSTCALWVPLYRQVTLGTWLQPKGELEKGLAHAYADVERAFAAYLAEAPAERPLVLIGHSQGAEMVVRLLRQYFPHDAALRARLVLAIAVGGSVDVAAGKTTGGTFDDIPVCTQRGQRGCVVAYRTHAAGEPVDAGRFVPPAGRETACVVPAALDADADDQVMSPVLSMAVLPTAGMFDVVLRGVHDVRTPFVALRGRYDAHCVTGPGGVSLAGGERARGRSHRPARPPVPRVEPWPPRSRFAAATR